MEDKSVFIKDNYFKNGYFYFTRSIAIREMNKLICAWVLLTFTSCNTDSFNHKEERQKPSDLKVKPLKDIDVLAFSIEGEKDTIEFIKVGKDTTKVRPTIIFLQGSLPIPLIFDLTTYQHINLPFDYRSIIEQYNLIVISMPNTPLVVGLDHLNQQYCYVPDTAKPNIFSQAYLKGNFLQNYVDRTQLVIKHLKDEAWVQNDELILIGHSQGAKIATVLASENERVSNVALLGFNAFGRYDELIRKERNKLESKGISGEEYKTNLRKHYEKWMKINEKPDDFQLGHRAWTSFSIDYLPYLLEIEVPIFVGYGTKDPIAANCDLIPIHFIQNGKTNLSLKPYVGLEHNFFEVSDGGIDRKNGAHFTEVIQDVLSWSEAEGSDLRKSIEVK